MSLGRPSFGDTQEVPNIAEEEIFTHRTDERGAQRAAAAAAAAAAAEPAANAEAGGTDRGVDPAPPLVVPASEPLPSAAAGEVRPEQLWNVHFGGDWLAPTALLTICKIETGEWLYARPMLKGEARQATTVYTACGEAEDVVFERRQLPNTSDCRARSLLPQQKVLFDFSATRGDTVTLEELIDKCPEHLLPHHLQVHQRRRKSTTPPGGTPRASMTVPLPPSTSPRARRIPDPPKNLPKTEESVDADPLSRKKEGEDPCSSFR